MKAPYQAKRRSSRVPAILFCKTGLRTSTFFFDSFSSNFGSGVVPTWCSMQAGRAPQSGCALGGKSLSGKLLLYCGVVGLHPSGPPLSDPRRVGRATTRPPCGSLRLMRDQWDGSTHPITASPEPSATLRPVPAVLPTVTPP